MKGYPSKRRIRKAFERGYWGTGSCCYTNAFCSRAWTKGRDKAALDRAAGKYRPRPVPKNRRQPIERRPRERGGSFQGRSSSGGGGGGFSRPTDGNRGRWDPRR